MLKARRRSLLTSSLGLINNPGQGDLRRGLRGFSGFPGITVRGVDSQVRGCDIVATIEHHDTVTKGGSTSVLLPSGPGASLDMGNFQDPCLV
jgi:hypothetical protein